MIESIAGCNGLPKVVLRHPGGASAEVYLQGAHVTSWKTADGTEQFFMSRESYFAPGKPIRGGIPVVFPQFSNQGPLPAHGVARTSAWTLRRSSAGDAGVQAVFGLTDTPETRALWDHAFALEYTVTLGEKSLTFALRVTNTGDQPFTFQMAFHTYFAIDAISATRVTGLEGVPFRDALQDWAEGVEDAAIRFTEETDRVYPNTPDTLSIVDDACDRMVTIQKSHLPDVVIWNPWIAKSQRMPDFGDDEYLRMVCAETGVIHTPIELTPGASWEGETGLRINAE